MRAKICRIETGVELTANEQLIRAFNIRWIIVSLLDYFFRRLSCYIYNVYRMILQHCVAEKNNLNDWYIPRGGLHLTVVEIGVRFVNSIL